MFLCSLVLYLTLLAGGLALYGTLMVYLAGASSGRKVDSPRGELIYRIHQLWRPFPPLSVMFLGFRQARVTKRSMCKRDRVIASSFECLLKSWRTKHASNGMLVW